MAKTQHKHPVIVVIGAVKKDNRYLLTKRTHRDPRFHDKWQLPGGGLEPGETIYQCLHRELKEETGVDIKNEYLIPKVFEVIRCDWHGIFFAFVCRLKNDQAKIVLDAEASDYGWFTLDEAKNLKTLKGTLKIMEEAEKIKV